MRKKLLMSAVVICCLALPALAFAGQIYSGKGTADPSATIEIKVAKIDGKQAVKKVVVDNLHYSGGLCGGSGRTPKATLRGSFKVKDGHFRAVGGGETADPLDSGEVAVSGDLSGTKITGTMRFTYGKTGCASDREEYKATR
jgi:hypothetical protein